MGVPLREASNCGIAFRSSAIFARISRLASVSRYRVCASEAGPRTSTQLQDFDLEVAAIVFDFQEIADMDVSCRFRQVIVAGDSA